MMCSPCFPKSIEWIFPLSYEKIYLLLSLVSNSVFRFSSFIYLLFLNVHNIWFDVETEPSELCYAMFFLLFRIFHSSSQIQYLFCLCPNMVGHVCIFLFSLVHWWFASELLVSVGEHLAASWFSSFGYWELSLFPFFLVFMYCLRIFWDSSLLIGFVSCEEGP